MLTEKHRARIAKKIEKVPGVSRSSRRQRASMMAASPWRFITVLLEPPDKREDIGDGQKVRAARRSTRHARPRITFPNVLGGRDTFAPIRAHAARSRHAEARRDRQGSQYGPAERTGLTDVKVNLNLNNPELQVNIDRQLGSDLGVRVSDVAGAVRLLMSGEDQISTFKEGSEQYPVTMRLNARAARRPASAQPPAGAQSARRG
jgi:hydrophobic/amphiphilic exporter-1 (mainly G- bacteria), HAE1 family